jgi:hypothetical protein
LSKFKNYPKGSIKAISGIVFDVPKPYSTTDPV